MIPAPLSFQLFSPPRRNTMVIRREIPFILTPVLRMTYRDVEIEVRRGVPLIMVNPPFEMTSPRPVPYPQCPSGPTVMLTSLGSPRVDGIG